MSGCTGYIKTESSARHLPSKTLMHVFYFRCVHLYAYDALCHAHAKCFLGMAPQLIARNVSVTKLEKGSHGEKWESR